MSKSNPWGPKGRATNDRRRFPTFEEVRAWAYRELGDLDDQLPTIGPAYRGTPPSAEQLDAVREACLHIAKAREALNRAAG